MTYQEHIESLAEELGVTINWLPERAWGQAESDSRPEHRTIWIAPPVGEYAERNYWIAMHELGHIVRTPGVPDWSRPNRVLEGEVAAHEWAFDNALEAPGQWALWALHEGLIGYLQYPGVTASVPPHVDALLREAAPVAQRLGRFKPWEPTYVDFAGGGGRVIA